VSLSLRADDKGILPDRMIATLVKIGAIIPAAALDEHAIVAITDAKGKKFSGKAVYDKA